MKKLLALILALALMASFTAVFAASETEPAPDLPPEAPVETESLVTEDLKKQIVPEAEVPDLIDYSVAVEEKYVCRAYWEETDLNEVVFLKSDGTLARYYFAIPVKYEENGEVFDKKPALVERETLLNNLYRYELTAQNDTAFYCPDNLTHGFLYRGGDMEVALRPITQSEYDFLRGHMNAGDLVLPQNILPEGYDSQAVTGTAQSALSVTDEETTAARYVLSTEGETVNSAFASQDILSAVPSYNGFQLQLDLAEGALTHTVYFELDSDLLPVPTEGGLLLCDRQGNALGILGDLLSESGVQNDIPWTVTESLSGTYLLSAILPRNGESYTVSTTQVFENLQDATIYEGDLGTYGISSDISVGYSNSYGTHRALIRPNNWTLLSSANPNLVIESATLVLYHTYQTDPTMNIEVRPFTGSTWEQSSVVWNDVSGGSYGAPVLDSKSISYSGNSGFYSFNITSRVRMWYNGNSSWQKGLVVRWTDEQYVYDESPCAVFAATEHSEELFRPHLMIQTSTLPTLEDGVYQITSAVTGNPYLTASDLAVDGYDTTLAPATKPVLMQATGSTQSLHQLWRVTHLQNGYYTVRPYHYTPAGLYASGTSALTAYLGYYDVWEEVPSGFLWYIHGTTTPAGCVPNKKYFYAQPFGSSYRLENYADVTAIDEAERAVTICDDYGGAEHRWIFTEVESPRTIARLYSTVTGEFVQNPAAWTLYGGETGTFLSQGLHLSICAPSDLSIFPSSYSWSTGEAVTAIYSDATVSFRSTGIGVVKVGLCFGTIFEQTNLLTINSFGTGNYYLSNLSNNMLLNAQNGTLVFSTLRGDALQNWEIKRYNSTNYHTISCTVDGVTYYLGLPDAMVNVGDVVVLHCATTQTISDIMLWELFFFGPNLRFKPKLSGQDNFAIGLQQESGQEEVVLAIKTSALGSDFSWYLYPFAECDKEIQVFVYADESYRTSTSEYENNIEKMLLRVKMFYASNFGVLLNTSSVMAVRSVADECTNRDAETGLCNCFDDCSQHHTNIDNLYEAIPTNKVFDEINIMFTKQSNLCRKRDGQCSENQATGTAVKDLRSICIYAFDANDTVSVLIHEIGHLFFATDHYDDVPNDNDSNLTLDEINARGGRVYNSNCTYGYNRSSQYVEDTRRFCYGCFGDIQAKLEEELIDRGVSS